MRYFYVYVHFATPRPHYLAIGGGVTTNTNRVAVFHSEAAAQRAIDAYHAGADSVGECVIRPTRQAPTEKR